MVKHLKYLSPAGYLSVLACLIALGAKPAGAAEIKNILLSDDQLLYLDLEPARQSDEINGPFADLFRAAGARIGRELVFERLPWKRAQRNAGLETNIGLGPLTRTSRREANFKWIAPLFPMRIVYLTKKNSGPMVRNVEHARQLRVGVKRGSTGTFTAKQHELPNDRVTIANTQDQLLSLLDAGRIDTWLVWDFIAYRVLKKYGKKFELEEGHSEILGDLYFAGSTDISDREAAEWRVGFQQINEEGVMDRILFQYLGRTMSPSLSSR